MWEAAPSEPIQTIFGTLGHLMDVINYAKFHVDRSRGIGLAGVERNACFPLQAKPSLTLFSAAALTVMVVGYNEQ